DMVIFIHRLDYQGLDENAEKGQTQIIIAKHRNGEIADIDMMFRASEVKFVEIEDSLVNQAARMPVESGMNDDAPFVSPGSGFGDGMGSNTNF
ncbi:MAG: replicative DNA helicase, partial [Bacteroidetes bacterium]|nr:replicative DNA helicase [Candidatus Cryptobacteroides intestinigallinarum]